jgi:hypothetical protein
MRKYAFWVAAGCMVLVVACSKNKSRPGGQTGQLVGNYTFQYLTTTINASESVSYLGQTASLVLIGGYKSKQNTGTVAFTADSAIGNGIGYSYDTTAMAIKTIPGTPNDTTYGQLSDTVPATSSSSKYTIIGTDSIYFPGGVIGAGSALNGSPIPVAPPTGGHFSFVGDTLIITTVINTTYPDNSLGVPATVNANVNATIKLLKQ